LENITAAEDVKVDRFVRIQHRYACMPTAESEKSSASGIFYKRTA